MATLKSRQFGNLALKRLIATGVAIVLVFGGGAFLFYGQTGQDTSNKIHSPNAIPLQRQEPPLMRALKAQDWAQAKLILEGPKTKSDEFAELAAQVIRWLDKEQSASNDRQMITDLLLKNAPADNLKPRDGLLLSRALSKIDLPKATTDIVKEVMGRLEKRHRDHFFIMSHLGTAQLPTMARNNLVTGLLSQDASLCVEYSLMTADLSDVRTSEEILKAGLKKFSKMNKDCRPVFAKVAITKLPQEMRKEKVFLKMTEQVRAGKGPFWEEAQKALGGSH